MAILITISTTAGDTAEISPVVTGEIDRRPRQEASEGSPVEIEVEEGKEFTVTVVRVVPIEG